MAKKSLYTCAGIRVILQRLDDIEKNADDKTKLLDGLHNWKVELEKELRNKEKWAEFYKGLRES